MWVHIWKERKPRNHLLIYYQKIETIISIFMFTCLFIYLFVYFPFKVLCILAELHYLLNSSCSACIVLEMSEDNSLQESDKQKEKKPERPPVPIRVSSRQGQTGVTGSTGIISMEQLQKEYADIARFKIFQLAGSQKNKNVWWTKIILKLVISILMFICILCFRRRFNWKTCHCI